MFSKYECTDVKTKEKFGFSIVETSHDGKKVASIDISICGQKHLVTLDADDLHYWSHLFRGTAKHLCKENKEPYVPLKCDLDVPS